MAFLDHHRTRRILFDVRFRALALEKMVTFGRLFCSRHCGPLSIIIIWVFLTFLPGLSGEFLNWDDNAHLVENPAVKNFDLPAIFSQCVQKVYIPLTTLTFAIEQKFFGDAPAGYHFNNLILHIINTVLVYFLALRLGMGLAAATVASLLFGVHPMRVESVCWVTERKDLLYAFFYLLSVGQYLKYLQTGENKDRAGSYILGILSLLAKPMALSLPLIFVLLDWFTRRKFSMKVLLEKAPLVLVFLPVVWMTYRWHIRNPIHDLGEALITWIWTFNFYLWKFVWPVDLVAVYQFPAPAGLSNPAHAVSIAAFMTIGISLFLLRNHRWFVFAMLYYLGSIFFLLRFDQTNDINIVADRFMYLPSLGFCWLAGIGAEIVWKKYSAATLHRTVMFVLMGLFFFLLSIRSIDQVKIWNNSVTLWTQVIEHYPETFVARNDRAVAFIFQGRNDLALEDYGAILKFDPDNADAFYNRGLLLQKMQRHQEAIMDFGEVMKRYPHYERVYVSRGKSWEAIGKDDRAIQDYSRALETTPAYEEAYLSRGNVFNRRGKLDQALENYRKVLEINPRHTRALNNCAAVYAQLNQDEKAMEMVNRAIALDSQYADAFFNRSVLQHRKGDLKSAMEDAVISQKLGAQLPQGYIEELQNLSRRRTD